MENNELFMSLFLKFYGSRLFIFYVKFVVCNVGSLPKFGYIFKTCINEWHVDFKKIDAARINFLKGEVICTTVG